MGKKKVKDEVAAGSFGDWAVNPAKLQRARDLVLKSGVAATDESFEASVKEQYTKLGGLFADGSNALGVPKGSRPTAPGAADDDDDDDDE